MKAIYLLLLIHSIFYSTPIETTSVNSTIEEVTVFQNSARITRRTKMISVDNNRHIFKLEGISPYIDKESVQIKMSGDGYLSQVKYVKNYLLSQQYNNQIKSLKNNYNTKKDSLGLITLKLKSLKEQEHFLKSNILITGENQSLKLIDLSEIAEYYSSEIEEIFSNIYGNEQTEKKLKKEMALINAQINELKPKVAAIPYDVLVTVTSKKSQSISLQMIYQVANAGWYSSYHLRAENMNQPIDLVHFANVYQNTGEKWENVMLSFTNENANLSKNIPTLLPMVIPPDNKQAFNSSSHRKNEFSGQFNGTIDRISGYVYDSFGEGLIGANIRINNTTTGTLTDLDGYFELHIPHNKNPSITISYTGFNSQSIHITQPQMNIYLKQGELLDEVVVTGVGGAANGLALKKQKPEPVSYSYSSPESSIKKTNLNFKYIMKVPYTIIDDSKNNEIALRELQLEASFKHKAIPKLSDKVYLTAFVDEWEDKNLLKGNMNLYYEGAYIGKSLLDPSVLKDSIQISLGIDTNIKIERERTRYWTKKKLISGKKHTEISYSIYVKNTKDNAINLEIWDQIPISTIKSIKVEKNEISEGFKLNRQNGIGHWDITLDAAKSRNFTISYNLNYPSHYHFNL
jgi:hypothetical protein